MSAGAVMGLTFFPKQWRAVTAPPGPVLVLAGPGAGKTRCLTGRIGYLLEQGADPRRVCAITFTNKAAHEIADRLRRGLGAAADGPTLGTIHSLCLRILREHGRRVGLPVSFGVADEEQQRLVLSRLGIPTSRHRATLSRFGNHRLLQRPLPPGDVNLFARYCRELRSHHLIDFDEILSLTLMLFESGPAVLAVYQARWDHLLVDEFQDLDPTQYNIARLLAREHRSLFAVGDDEQSIFSWRGADPLVMARFARDFGVREPIVLDVNCRCARGLFDAARRILPPPLPLFAKQIAAVHDSPFPIRAVRFADDAAEAEWIADDLREELKSPGFRRGDFAVLYRNHQTGQRLEEALIAAGIPCQLGKGLALADDPVIAPLLASLRIVARPDDDLAVEQLSRRLLGEAVLTEIGRRPGPTWTARLRALAEDPDAPDAASCWRLLYQVENLRSLRRLHGTLPDLVEAVLEHGIGRLEGPLEVRHELLRDPAESPTAHALANTLSAVADRGGRILITPDGGLEIPVKVMITRALPERAVDYLGCEPATPADVVVSLRPGLTGGATVTLDPSGKHLRVVQVFRALQLLAGRRFRKTFADYTVFDTETTGTDVERDEVLELAAVRVRGGRVVETFRSLVRCNRPVPASSTAVHGYTDVDLHDQPTLQEVWPRFRAFAGDDLLVAHNGHRFDVPLLRRLTADCGGTDGLSFLDTLPLARSLFPVASLRLDDLAARLDVQRGRGHHALDDCLCLAAVFERLQEERLRRARKTCLSNLLDCLFLGAALEGRPPQCPEDAALVEASRWRQLPGRPAIVDAYVEAAERAGLRCPPLAEVLARVQAPGWPGAGNRQDARDSYPESYERLHRLVDLVRATDPEEALAELLDKAALSASDGAGIDAARVTLLTFHATKGLEFARVYLAGVEDQVLVGPNAAAEDEAEARRLLYVAMTRARDRVTLTVCDERQGRPGGGTRFLADMGLSATPATSR
jgi:DNA polymerase III epsilon subunit family exonuclease